MKVLLYSGGMDSWLIDKLWKPDLKVYVNINGDYSKEEIKRLPSDVKIIDFSFLGEQELENKFVPLRNLYFLMMASHLGDELCLGATAGDGSKDKCLDFLIDTEKTLNNLWHDKKINKDIKIEKKFVKMSKSEIIDEYLKSGGNIDEIKQNTFSCYTPKDNNECFECYPCFRKFAILYSKGCNYSYEEKKKMWEFIRSYIIPTKEEGGYPGTYYTDRGEESTHLIKAIELLKEEFKNDR